MRSIPSSYRPQLRKSETLPPFEAQERDFDILRAVQENRFLTRSLLVNLFPPLPTRVPSNITTGASAGTNIDRRLAKMFHHGYLERIKTVRGGEYVYAITTAGLYLLHQRQPKLPLAKRADNRDLKIHYIDHALMIARLRVAIITATRELPSLELSHFERESLNLKATWREAGDHVSVNPDAYFILTDRATNTAARFLVETDRGTMPIIRQSKKQTASDFASKFRNYSTMNKRGAHASLVGGADKRFGVLTITSVHGRAENLADAAHALLAKEEQPRFYFASESDYASAFSNLFARIWRRADNPKTMTAIVSQPLPTKNDAQN